MIVSAQNLHLGRRCVREACRLLALASGGLLTLLGIAVTVTPIPFGAVLTALGLVVLISASATVARLLREVRRRTRPLDRMLCVIERFCPCRVARVLRSTRPLQPCAAAVRVTP